eukprot:9987948-Ditylum_brightwellii.AAC.1
MFPFLVGRSQQIPAWIKGASLLLFRTTSIVRRLDIIGSPNGAVSPALHLISLTGLLYEMPSIRHPQALNYELPNMSPPFVQPRGKCIVITPINGHPSCVPCAIRRKKLFFM